MNSLSITERRVENALILDLNGKIRLGDDNAKLHTLFRSLAERGENNILLNLAGVSYIDSSGVGELIAGYIAIRKQGGQVKLLNLTQRIHELMMLTKLLTVFDTYENESEAVNSFGSFASNLSGHQSHLVM